MEVIRTSKGGDKLLHNGYAYVKKKDTANGTQRRWVCEFNRTDLRCKGAITTDLNPIQNPRNPRAHDQHQASNSRAEALKARCQLKEGASQIPLVPTTALVAQTLQNVPQAAVGEVGSLASMKRTVQRQKAAVRPPEPQSLALINLLPPWTTTGGLHPRRFLIYDSGPQDPRRFIVFGSDNQLRQLCSSDEWYADGNFKMAPNIYLQLYVLRAHLDDGAVSCVYAFLAGKTSVDYQNMLQAVARQCVQLGIVLNPSHLMIDFELAMHNAFRAQFGANVQIHGCFFHLCKSTWRQIQSLGLVQTYQNDPLVKKCVGMMDGLAFLPVNQVHLGVVAVQAEMTNTNAALLPLLAYFLQYYVGTWAPNQNNIMVFQPPHFPMDMWNMFNTIRRAGRKANNACEGWNSHFKKLLNNVVHPPFYTCIQGLQRDAALADNVITLSRAGQRHRHELRQNYVIAQNNLEDAVTDYANGRYANNVRQYLERISHHIRF